MSSALFFGESKRFERQQSVRADAHQDEQSRLLGLRLSYQGQSVYVPLNAEQTSAAALLADKSRLAAILDERLAQEQRKAQRLKQQYQKSGVGQAKSISTRVRKLPPSLKLLLFAFLLQTTLLLCLSVLLLVDAFGIAAAVDNMAESTCPGSCDIGSIRADALGGASCNGRVQLLDRHGTSVTCSAGSMTGWLSLEEHEESELSALRLPDDVSTTCMALPLAQVVCRELGFAIGIGVALKPTSALDLSDGAISKLPLCSGSEKTVDACESCDSDTRCCGDASQYAISSLALYTICLNESDEKTDYSLAMSFELDPDLTSAIYSLVPLVIAGTIPDFSGLSRLLEAYEAWVAFAETRCGALSESMRSCADLASAGLCTSPLSLFLNPSAMLLLTAHVGTLARHATRLEATPHMACAALHLLALFIGQTVFLNWCSGEPQQWRTGSGLGSAGRTTILMFTYLWGVSIVAVMVAVVEVHVHSGWRTFAIVAARHTSLVMLRLHQWFTAATEWCPFMAGLYTLAVALNYLGLRRSSRFEIMAYACLGAEIVFTMLAYRNLRLFKGLLERQWLLVCLMLALGVASPFSLVLTSAFSGAVLRDAFFAVHVFLVAFFTVSRLFHLAVLVAVQVHRRKIDRYQGYSPARQDSSSLMDGGDSLPSRVRRHITTFEQEHDLNLCVLGSPVLLSISANIYEAHLLISSDLTLLRWSLSDFLLISEILSVDVIRTMPSHFAVTFQRAAAGTNGALASQEKLDVTCASVREASRWVRALSLLIRLEAINLGLHPLELQRLRLAFRIASASKGPTLTLSQQMDFFGCLNRAVSRDELKELLARAQLEPTHAARRVEHVAVAFKRGADAQHFIPKRVTQPSPVASASNSCAGSFKMRPSPLHASGRVAPGLHRSPSFKSSNVCSIPAAFQFGSGRLDFRNKSGGAPVRERRRACIGAEGSFSCMLHVYAEATRDSTASSLFYRYAKAGSKPGATDRSEEVLMNFDAFLTFWESEQLCGDFDENGEVVATRTDWEERAKLAFECYAALDSAGINMHEFQQLLLSAVNSAWSPRHAEVHQDMSKPLSHYYINSSHNTFLTGNQLTSDSSELMYRHALLSGIRCIEIDVFGGPQGEPQVYHQYTRTSHVPFRLVVQTINDFAFPPRGRAHGISCPAELLRASEYPVIISVENHCPKLQQERMAEILTTVLGEKLYVGDGADESPEALRHRVLIKGKKLRALHAECARLSQREQWAAERDSSPLGVFETAGGVPGTGAAGASERWRGESDRQSSSESNSDSDESVGGCAPSKMSTNGLLRTFTDGTSCGGDETVGCADAAAAPVPTFLSSGSKGPQRSGSQRSEEPCSPALHSKPTALSLIRSQSLYMRGGRFTFRKLSARSVSSRGSLRSHPSEELLSCAPASDGGGLSAAQTGSAPNPAAFPPPSLPALPAASGATAPAPLHVELPASSLLSQLHPPGHARHIQKESVLGKLMREAMCGNGSCGVYTAEDHVSAVDEGAAAQADSRVPTLSPSHTAAAVEGSTPNARRNAARGELSHAASALTLQRRLPSQLHPNRVSRWGSDCPVAITSTDSDYSSMGSDMGAMLNRSAFRFVLQLKKKSASREATAKHSRPASTLPIHSAPPSQPRKHKERVCQALSDLTAIRGVRFAGFGRNTYAAQADGCAGVRPPLHSTSFKEGRALSLEQESRAAWQAHNRTFISRVYPSGRRVDSSNPSDTAVCRLWAAGVQMVALNIQTWDQTMMLNQAMFQQNGNCGYVLRPPLFPGETAAPPSAVRLSIRLISAHNLPKLKDKNVAKVPVYLREAHSSDETLTTGGVISPMVEIELVGGSVAAASVGSERCTMSDGATAAAKRSEQNESLPPNGAVRHERWARASSVVEGNGLSAEWNDDPVVCDVAVPNSAFLRLSVYAPASRLNMLGARGKSLVAYAALPLSAMRGGYRSLQLRSPATGTPIDFSALLCHVRLQRLSCCDAVCSARSVRSEAFPLLKPVK